MNNFNFICPEARKYLEKFLDLHLTDSRKILERQLSKVSPEELESRFLNKERQQDIDNHYSKLYRKIRKEKCERQQEKRKVRKPRPREKFSPPKQTKRYVKNMSLYYAYNPQLSPMAYRLLIILFGWCGNRPNKKVNVTSFATQLCITRRTAQRYLAELRDLGIIITTHAKTRIGMIEGIFVIFNPLVRQCFPKNTNFDAENRRKKDVKQISQLTKNFTHGTSKKTHINININLKRGNSGFT